MNLSIHSLPQRQIFMKEKLYCVYGEITMVLFILN